MSITAADTAMAAAEYIPQESGEIFYQSAEFWVGCAFVLVVYLLAKPIYKAVKAMIEQRIKRIKDELQYAEELKLDAQKLYAEYERKYLNTEQEVAQIIANEEAVIEENKKRKMQAMESWLRQKNAEADARIEMAAEKANTEINALISRKTIAILKSIFRTKITKAEHQKLINSSIKKLETMKINE